MSKFDDGGAAFPPVHDPAIYSSGMSLRDYFAAKALQGLLANPNIAAGQGVVDGAYQLADAMLARRSKQ